MSILRLKYVDSYRDRHGRLRRYLRRPGHKRIPLEGEPGSPAFLASYSAAWAAADKTPIVTPEIGASRTKPRSVNALVASYYKSAAYLMLAASSRRVRKNILEKFRLEHGDDPVADLEPKHVRAMIQKKAAGGRPHAANGLLKCLRTILRHAVDLGWRDDDPSLGVRKLRSKSEGFHSWTDDEIADFEKRWAIGTRERLALALLLFTAQRRADMVRMGRQHINRDGMLDVRQQKTGAALAIPLHPELKAILDATPKTNLTFLTTAYGKPFSAPGFTNWFREACYSAGLPGCSAHGLRKAAARRLAEAGCTAHQIGAITGHRTLAELERYTRAVDQRRLAQDAIGALSQRANANEPGTNDSEGSLTTLPAKTG